MRHRTLEILIEKYGRKITVPSMFTIPNYVKMKYDKSKYTDDPTEDTNVSDPQDECDGIEIDTSDDTDRYHGNFIMDALRSNIKKSINEV